MEKLVPQPQALVAFGFAHGEVAAHQLVRVVQFGAAQKVETRGVHDNARRAALDDQIIRGDRLVQVELVLEAAAAAGQHGYAQGGGAAVRGDDLGYAGQGSVGHGERHDGDIGGVGLERKEGLLF